MPQTTSSISELLVPGLSKIFFDAFKEREAEWPKFLNRRTSKRNFEEDLEMAGFGTMPTKDEGNPIQFQNILQGTKRRYTHVSYGLGFRVTEEAMDDDLYGPIQRAPRLLARSARDIREQVSANVLNLGFTTEVGFKSEALFTATHTLLRGGTSSNRASTDADLGVAALEAAIITIDEQKTEEGFPTLFVPRMLICGPQLMMIAEELLGSPMRPDTANNAINPLARRGISWMVSHYLTDADSWFVISDEHDLNMFLRKEISFQAGDDFDTGDAKFKSTQRFVAGHGDWRGTYGSLGA